MEKILLSSIGETLKPSENASDNSNLIGCIGNHVICGGWMDIKYISLTHSAITCKSCFLRIVIPVDVKTYGQLREHLKF